MRLTDAAVNEPAEAVSALMENVARADVLMALRGLIDGDIEAGWPIVERYLIPAGMALLFLLVAYLFAGMISRICSRPIRRKVDETLGRFIGKIIFYSIFALAAI
ncbi:MAG: hypothetical protein ABGX07_11190, partial [Pirellulaceae bacterium]